jgi:hypothetical protein
MYLNPLIFTSNAHHSALPCSPVYPLIMPESPSDHIEGTRKRKPSRRVIENGDTLIKKKTKTTLASSMPLTTQSSTTSIISSRTTTTRKTSSIAAPSSPPHAQPHAPKDADKNGIETETGNDTEPDPIEVSDGDDDWEEMVEDDEAELSECSNLASWPCN